MFFHKSTNSFISPLQGSAKQRAPFKFPGRCPGLSYLAPSGQKIPIFPLSIENTLFDIGYPISPL